MIDGGKIHLMVKKGEGINNIFPAAGSSKTPTSPPALDFFKQLDTFLGKHLTQDQTNKVVNEFRKVMLHTCLGNVMQRRYCRHGRDHLCTPL